MVKKQVDKDRVQHGNRGRLGWRKNAAEDATNNHRRRQQGWE